MSGLAKGGLGGGGANRANRANRGNPPPSDPAPARQVTFQVTYGVGWGANRANRGGGVGGGDPALCDSGPTSGPCYLQTPLLVVPLDLSLSVPPCSYSSSLQPEESLGTRPSTRENKVGNATISPEGWNTVNLWEQC